MYDSLIRLLLEWVDAIIAIVRVPSTEEEALAKVVIAPA